MISIDKYEFDENLYYYTGGDGHVWVKKLDDGKIRVGFDDFGQQLAGKILFVRTVSPGKERPKAKVWVQLKLVNMLVQLNVQSMELLLK